MYSAGYGQRHGVASPANIFKWGDGDRGATDPVQCAACVEQECSGKTGTTRTRVDNNKPPTPSPQESGRYQRRRDCRLLLVCLFVQP